MGKLVHNLDLFLGKVFVISYIDLCDLDPKTVSNDNHLAHFSWLDLDFEFFEKQCTVLTAIIDIDRDDLSSKAVMMDDRLQWPNKHGY